MRIKTNKQNHDPKISHFARYKINEPKNRSIPHLFQGYNQKNAKSRVIVMVSIRRNKKLKQQQ